MREGWERVRLGELLTSVRRPAQINPAAQYKLVTLPLHGAGARLRKVVRGSELGSAKYEVRAGDLMVSKIDARKGSNSLLPPELEGAIVTGDFLSYTVDASTAAAQFVDLMVRTPWFEELCDSVSGGTTNRVRLDPKRFLELEVDLPPLAEQLRSIDLIAALDESIEATISASQMSKQLRATVIAGVDAPMMKLGSLLERIETGKSPSGEERAPLSGERAVLKVSAIGSSGFVPSEVKVVAADVRLDPATSISADDVLVVRANGVLSRVGVSCQVDQDHPDLYLCDKTFRLVPRRDLISPTWLNAALSRADVRQELEERATGSDMRNISQKALKEVALPVPTLAEQDVVGGSVETLGELMSSLTGYVGRLRALRAELLTALLSGAHEIPESYDEAMGAELVGAMA